MSQNSPCISVPVSFSVFCHALINILAFFLPSTQTISNADSREHLRKKFLRDQYNALLWAMRRGDGDWTEVVTQQLGNDIVGFITFLQTGGDGPEVGGDGDERAALDESVSSKQHPLATAASRTCLYKLYDSRFIARSRREYFRMLCRTLCGATSFTHNYAPFVDTLVHALSQPQENLRPHRLRPVRKAATPHHGKLTRVEAFHHLFIWSVLMSQPAVAHVFWIKGGYSLQNALLGCQMLKNMATLRSIHRHLKYQPHVTRFLAMASKLEEAALGVLTQVRGKRKQAHTYPMDRSLVGSVVPLVVE